MLASMIQRVGIERIRASSPVGIGATQWVSLPMFAYFSDVQNWRYADVMPPRISNTPKMMPIFHHRIVNDAPLRSPQLASRSSLMRSLMATLAKSQAASQMHSGTIHNRDDLSVSSPDTIRIGRVKRAIANDQTIQGPRPFQKATTAGVRVASQIARSVSIAVVGGTPQVAAPDAHETSKMNIVFTSKDY